jgi:hypothetical protein
MAPGSKIRYVFSVVATHPYASSFHVASRHLLVAMPTYSVLRTNRKDRIWYEALEELNPYYIPVFSHGNSRQFGYSGALHARGSTQHYDCYMPVLMHNLQDVQGLEETLGGGIFLRQKGLGVSPDHRTRVATLDFGLHDDLAIVDHAVMGAFIETLQKHGRRPRHNCHLAEVACFSTPKSIICPIDPHFIFVSFWPWPCPC